MRAVIQRVSKASVLINQEFTEAIDQGFVVLLGIENEDTSTDVKWLVQKIINMRVFNDSEDKMNLSLMDTEGELLIISQFTLHASTKKGNRPSFIKAAKPEFAKKIYQEFIDESRKHCNLKNGKFGAHMEVSLINNGPVTIIIDSKNRV